jgi:hypothetical protein
MKNILNVIYYKYEISFRITKMTTLQSLPEKLYHIDDDDLLEWYDEDQNEIYDFKNQEIEVSSDDMALYNNFCEFIEDVLSGDTWALTVNEEVLFNYYNLEDKTYTQNVLDDVIRDKLIDNIHSSLFVQLFRKHKNAEIKIYMFDTKSWAYIIQYNAENMSFKVSLS